MRPPVPASNRMVERLEGALLGAAAGVAAAGATAFFQAVWGREGLPPTASGADRPPTEKVADALSREVAGKPLPERERGVAGALVHYAMGAGLGAAYALLARSWPAAREGRGAAFGLGVWATVEEIGLALFRLKPPPWAVAPAEHLFAASSHLVFGVTLDAILEATPQWRALIPTTTERKA